MVRNPWVCGACGKRFSGLGGFDAHRVGRHTSEHPHYGRRCLGMFELSARAWSRSDPGDIWRMPVSNSRRAQLAQLRGESASTGAVPDGGGV